MKKYLLLVGILALAISQASATSTVLAFYDTSGHLLYSTNLTFLTGGGADTGQTLGYTSTSANIGSITMTDNYIGATNLDVDGTIVPIPGLNIFGGAPQTFGPGITWSSTNFTKQGGSIFGYTGTYGYLANGFWDGALGPMIGLNDSVQFWGVRDTMTLSFATPITSFSAFFNYVPNSPTPTPEPGTLAMLGSGLLGAVAYGRRKLGL